MKEKGKKGAIELSSVSGAKSTEDPKARRPCASE